METILIAGGTGLIGKQLSAYWQQHGHTVRLLTRQASNPETGRYHWNPQTSEMDATALEGVTVLVNLCGAGIADKRWTKTRIKELFDSRVETTACLWQHAQASPTLKHYISASGAVCYGFEDDTKTYVETDPFGSDLLSEITREWEAAADRFSEKCPVTKIRISVVIAGEGGAIPTIAKPIRMGFGAILGSGTQAVPWIHIHDLVRVFDWTLINNLSGVYHANAGNTDNATLTRAIATALGKKIWLPKAPSFVMKLVLGSLSVMVLKGVKVSNGKLVSSGFLFEEKELEGAIKDVLK
ncbi:MAG: TIGR01777 family oxidoreductase [Fluviicola sp.]|nr:TIGR01777 family oxidoreductase [Fluviicola sp.]